MDSETGLSYSVLQLPNFIKQPPLRFRHEDIALLIEKGAFKIPEADLRKEIIGNFARYVYPDMPIIDLPGFISTTASIDTNRQISLLLFQAVMFAGAASVSLHHLCRLGFSTRRQARLSLFVRVKMLFDLDYESNSTIILQSILLISHWNDKLDGPKDTWHLIGVALSIAFKIGLHCDPGTLDISVTHRGFRKRLWWSLFIQDKLLALGTRRPIHVENDCHNVSMVAWNDFAPISSKVLGNAVLEDFGITDFAQQETALIQNFIERAKLSMVIGNVLLSQYSIVSHTASSPVITAMMYSPRVFYATTEEFRSCDRMLDDWRAEAFPGIQKINTGIPISFRNEAVLHLHRSQLRLLFLAVKITLHRPLAIEPPLKSSIERKIFHGIATRTVRNTAFEISSIFEDLQSRYMTPVLSESVVTSLLAAMMYHIVNLKADDRVDALASYHWFLKGRHTLDLLSDTYVSASLALKLVTMAMIKSELSYF